MQVNLQTSCLHCQHPIDLSGGADIRIGSLCKVVNEEVVEGAFVVVAGVAYQEAAETRLVSRVFPMTMKGVGCPKCGRVMMKAIHLAATEAPKVEPYIEWARVSKVQLAGETFTKRDGRWFGPTYIAVPTAEWGLLEGIPSVSRMEARVNGSGLFSLPVSE